MLVYKINGSLSLMVYLKPVNISNVSWIYKRLEQFMIITPVELLSNVRRIADTKGVIRIRKSKKNRQRNGQNKKDNRTSSDLQSTTQKTKDRAT